MIRLVGDESTSGKRGSEQFISAVLGGCVDLLFIVSKRVFTGDLRREKGYDVTDT